ncbi:MAG: DUF4384 domain-containing protein [SAR324 cluster bacterium]|nr:DUF4384 domain-containing protein [SAR324 cluster bacterium]
MKKLFLILLFTGFVTISHAETCYLLVERAGNFDGKLIQSLLIPIVNQYRVPVEPPPFSGVRPSDCTYTVSVSESMQGFLLTLSGPQLNIVGTSKTPGTDGVIHALLQGMYGTLTQTERAQICNQYKHLMKSECQPVSAVVALYDQNLAPYREGREVREGEKFNVMLQPDDDVYAYVINRDTQENYFVIFPNTDVSQHKNPLKKGQKYYFPPLDSDVVFGFDHNPGQETFYFVMSTTPMNDLDELFVKLQSSKNPSQYQATGAQLEKAVASRGIALKKQSNSRPSTKVSNGELDSKLGELLQGNGAFVEMIRLSHVR